MITKFTLTISGVEHDVTDCLKNWQDVVCAYKRSDYSGVVRSFTSSFDFALEAYNLLLNEYLASGYDAKATLTAYTLNNRFGYDKRFECALDFSTKKIADGVFTINAVDDSIAAMIKANKSTKYEFAMGEDIIADGTFNYDRMPMKETVTYAFTKGESDPETGAITCTYTPPEDGSRMMWVGSVADEVSVGGTVFWNDDQENNKDGYAILALKNVDVTIDASVVNDHRVATQEIQVYARVMDSNGEQKSSTLLFRVGWAGMDYLGEFESAESLEQQHPSSSYTADKGGHVWAQVDGIAFILDNIGHRCVWKNTEKAPDEYFRTPDGNSATVSLASGDKMQIVSIDQSSTFKVLTSKIQLSWNAVGETVGVPCLKPGKVAESLLVRICEKRLRFNAVMSAYDARLSKTVVMPAESIRNISNAKLYTSFNEFCDWMSAVFGYTYYLGKTWQSQFTQTPKTAGYADGAAYPISTTPYYGEVETSRIYYCNSYGKFMYAGADGKHYDMWPTSADYNAANRARTDTVFIINTQAFYFTADSNEPKRYNADPSLSNLLVQDVHFVHRTELFSDSAPVVEIANVRDVTNACIASQIFASVEIGYEKKDYDSVNGRDEWNFSNEYTTGCAVSDKKLSLISKYRADCYGIEFACQKRNKDTTDSGSDKDTFFAYCDFKGEGNWSPNRTVYPIEGAMNDKVFNGAFTPLRCVFANAGYIGMQAKQMTLKFASSKGNTDIKVMGAPVSANIVLSAPMLMSETVEFTTDDIRQYDTSSLVRITDRGVTYAGFISEVEYCYAQEQSVKYKLTLKSIEI